MFPARAGMSRLIPSSCVSPAYVPRASGDEPTGIYKMSISAICSPRERG